MARIGRSVAARSLTSPTSDGVAEGRLSLRVWLHLMKSSKAIEAVVAGRLRTEYGQSFSRFDVLSQLVRVEGDFLPVGKLAQLLMTSNGNITALLDRMAAEGLLERKPSPKDRRSQPVRITDDGRSLFAGMNRRHAKWIDAALADLPDADKEKLVTSLIRVRHAFEAETVDR